MTIRSWLNLAVPLALICLPSDLHAQNVFRIEVKPIETVTLKTQQVLTGNPDGKPTVIAGELRIPKPGTDKLPAVILVHGSGGVSAATDRWAQEINSLGVAAFILGSFSGRGISNTVNDQSQLDSLAMLVDAYRALGILAQHPRLDANRIGIMGFSKGAVAAVYSSNERFQKLYAPEGVKFAIHVGFYTPCNTAYRDTTKPPARRSSFSTASPTTGSQSARAATTSPG